MPTVYLRKDLHEAIVLKREDVNNFVNRAVEEALKQSVSEVKENLTKPKLQKIKKEEPHG